jgi:hypothetical protein
VDARSTAPLKMEEKMRCFEASRALWKCNGMKLGLFLLPCLFENSGSLHFRLGFRSFKYVGFEMFNGLERFVFLIMCIMNKKCVKVRCGKKWLNVAKLK